MTGTESQEAAVVTEVQDHEEELQQPQKHLHRTSFHYQPVKNWMGDQKLLQVIELFFCMTFGWLNMECW